MNRIEATRLKRSLLEAVITTIVLTVAVPCALAQTETWNGGTGNWDVAGNWTPNGVPNSSTTNVVITGTSGTPSSVTLNNLGTTIQDLSLDSFSTLSISGGGYLAVAGSTITNAGQINVGDSSVTGTTLYIGPSVTLSGGGTISLNNSSDITSFTSGSTLMNQSTIQGQGSIDGLNFTNQGTVNANVSGGQLSVALATNLNGLLVTNDGTLEATGGGQLVLSNVTNTNGTIFAGSSSTVYITPDSTIIGGNLTSASGGEIQGANLTTLQGVTITQGSTYSIEAGFANSISGNLVNQGTVLIGVNGIGSTLYIESSTSTFSGGGTVNLSNGSIQGLTSTQSLVNQDNTIQGQGVIGYLSSFINGGTVNANVSGGTLSIESAPTTNNGTFQVTEGSTLQVNTSFTTTGTVNIGALTDTSASLFQMAGGNNYVQTGGTTSLWSAHSTLSAPTVDIEGGLLQGFGTVQGNLVNSGAVHAGDGPGIFTVHGTYTQNASGILDIAIGGLTSGSQYSVLSVSGNASLSGMLDVSLVNGFSPTIDDIFVILTSSGLSGTFTDNTIEVGNVTFDVEYSPAGYKNDVVLLVAQVSSVPEPASLVMLTIGIAGVGVYVARRHGKTARA